MEGFLRKIWVVLLAFTIFGILSWVPVDEYQKSYMDKLHAIKSKPQKRVESSYMYVDYIEDGGAPNSTYTYYEPPAKKHRRKHMNQRHRKPYFIRDIKNPNILYPYRG